MFVVGFEPSTTCYRQLRTRLTVKPPAHKYLPKIVSQVPTDSGKGYATCIYPVSFSPPQSFLSRPPTSLATKPPPPPDHHHQQQHHQQHHRQQRQRQHESWRETHINEHNAVNARGVRDGDEVERAR